MSNREIGGYFELELPYESEGYHPSALRLNSCRNAFGLLLETICPKRVFMPHYLCHSMFQPLEDLKAEVVLYDVDDKFEITQVLEFQEGDLLLYVNYFGLKSGYIRDTLSRIDVELVVDNSQAFFDAPEAYAHSVYSPRKFFGVPDGGLLVTSNNIDGSGLQTDNSLDLCTHLIGRINHGAASYYESFKQAEKALDYRPSRRMSHLTSRILNSIDYASVKNRREENFAVLDALLSSINDISLPKEKIEGPMVYPLLLKSDASSLREHLISRKVYVPMYWPEVVGRVGCDAMELQLVRNLLPLPIDHRYTKDDMERIADEVLSF